VYVPNVFSLLISVHSVTTNRFAISLVYDWKGMTTDFLLMFYSDLSQGEAIVELEVIKPAEPQSPRKIITSHCIYTATSAMQHGQKENFTYYIQ